MFKSQFLLSNTRLHPEKHSQAGWFSFILKSKIEVFFFEANENLNIKGLMVSDFLAAVLKMSIKKNPVDLLFLFCVKKEK